MIGMMQISGVSPSILPGMVQLNLTVGGPSMGNQTSPIQALASSLGKGGPIQALLVAMG